MSAPPPPPARAVAASRVEMTKIVLPQYANALGNIFGGLSHGIAFQWV